MIDHLKDIKSSPVWDDGRLIKSVPDAIAKVMREYREYFEGFSRYVEDTVSVDMDSVTTEDKKVSGELCPSCGEPLYMAAGCSECGSCGYSKCG
jgi:ribonucleoside-diphosphate reductase alpha chain